MLGQDSRGRQKPDEQLNKIDFNTLTTKALNVDRLDTGGLTVSRFLVCHKHGWNRSNDFSKKNLEHTSLKVENEVLNKLELLERREHMIGVLRHLHGRMPNLSGKMLENAVMELFSHGTTCEWQTCAVGMDSWVRFSIAQKTQSDAHSPSGQLHTGVIDC